MKSGGRTSVIGASMALFTFAYGGAAQSQAPVDSTSATSFSTEQQAATSRYWTEERIRSATPLETPEISQTELQALIKGAEPRRPEVRPSPLPTPRGFAPTLPSRADVSAAPYTAAGKLFFTDEKGIGRSCTAQFIGRDVLMTAAHCVRAASGPYFTNFKFYRAYVGAPQQKFSQEVAVVCARTHDRWVSGGPTNIAFDYAFLKTKQVSTGGFFYLRRGLPSSRWEAIGYPENFGNAKIMYKVIGSNGPYTTTAFVQMVGNPMRHGNSGGAWHIRDATSKVNVVLGVNAYHANDTTDEFSPYVNEDVLNLYDIVRNGC